MSHKGAYMKYEIKGDNFPIVEISLNKGEKLVTEAGAMAWKTSGFQMETDSNGGFEKAFGRLFMGERLFQNNYTSEIDGAKITLSSGMPGAIIAVPISDGHSLICQKSTFLAAYGNINLDIFLNEKPGVGFFGGEGFIMEKISGSGIVFLEIDGSKEEFDLTKGEVLYVDTGSLVTVEDTCQISIESTGGGLKNKLFGGHGFFNTIITGPGHVVTQTMPVRKLARSVDPYITHPERNN